MTTPELKRCPDCGRDKAITVEDVAAGLCPKWWTIRDQMAVEDCKRHAARALSLSPSTKRPMTEIDFSPPFSYVPIPLDADGQGPADEADAVSTTHEVWDANCFTVATCGSEETARKVAELLNRSAAALRAKAGDE